ncbi:hypothetical protein L0337_14265 [candidate division KSB1 bacterium]|nr:hypothetical protein [candidate division KSB1 bacterium]
METGIDKKVKDLLYKLVSIYLGIDFIFWGFSNFTTDYDFDTRTPLKYLIYFSIMLYYKRGEVKNGFRLFLDKAIS